jgi:hydrogenase-4 component B
MANSFWILMMLVIPGAASLIGAIQGNKNESLRNTLHLLVYAFVFGIVVLLYEPVSQGDIVVFVPNLMGTGLMLKLDMLRYIFVWLTAFIWPLAMIFSTQYLIRHKNRNRYYALYMLTYFSTMGMFLSENILNLFTFFELMSISSYFLVIHDEDEYAHRAGTSYLAMAIAGGLMVLLGILLAYNFADTLIISEMDLKDASQVTRIAIGSLILIGFGIKASLFPLHVWLPKAYTAAPMPATIILSAVLAKTGVFGIIVTLHYLLDGEPVIAYAILILGMLTILVGGALAMYQRNVKRILAYSSMSQMGYILLGIALIEILGSHGGLAVYGTLFHIVNHGIIKTLLFIGAGVIYIALHELSINVIYGFGRLKHFLKALFLFGALAVAGMPGLNGYASKTMIHEALLEAAHEFPGPLFSILDLLFYFGSAMTVAYMLKFFVAVFIEKNDEYYGQHRHLIKWPVLLPMSILSGAIAIFGMRPEWVYAPLSQAAEILGASGEVHPHLFGTEALRASGVIFVLGFTMYATFIRIYLRKKVDGHAVYVNPSNSFFRIEEDLMIPVFTAIFKGMTIFFRFFDQWLIRLGEFIGDSLHKLADVKPKKWIETNGINLSDAGTHLIESMENASSGKFAQPLIEKGDAALGKLTGEKLSEPLHRSGEAIAHLADESLRKGHKLKDEGETTVRKAVYRANFNISTVTYSIFLFGAILVLSFIFIFLNSTLVKY